MSRDVLTCVYNKACKPTFPLRIVVDVPTLQENEGGQLVRAIQHTLDDLNEFSAHHLRLTLGDFLGKAHDMGIGHTKPTKEEQEPALTIQLEAKEGIQAVEARLRPHSTILDIFYSTSQALSTSSSSSALANSIAKTLQDIFSEEQAGIAYILASNSISGNGQQTSTSLGHQSQSSSSISGTSREQKPPQISTLTPEFAGKLARRTTRALKYAPTYHITISLFTPTAVPSSWDIEAAINESLLPLLRSFSISNFTVDTQVQLYATFSPSAQQPEFDTENKIWTLRKEELSGFINSAEWPLGPSIGTGPTLHFVLYVPDEKMAPLVVKESHASSWLVPQWGGVTILNPSPSTTTVPSFLTRDMIQPSLLTFSHQLLSLLGAPDSPPSFPMQLQTLTRIQAVSLLYSASSTMGSLARLTESLASIPVPGNVALGVDKTLSHLRETCSSLRDGNFIRALEHARTAEAEAEKAFFEKSMVGQVYFPDEHKIAVYLPLLGPIGVPLVLSLVKEVKRFRKRS